MARTTATIASVIESNVIANLAAQGITPSASSVAEWKLYKDAVAESIHDFEVVEDVFKSDVVKYINEKEPAGIAWYAKIGLEFQYGDSLSISAQGIPYYAVIDETKQIVKQCSVTEVQTSIGVVLVMKVAKVNSYGNYIPVSSLEKAAFESYMKARKWAGTNIVVVSKDADIILYALSVKYDALYAMSDVETRILLALEAFRTAARFDAVVYQSALLSAILNVAGVVACEFDLIQSTPNGGTAVPIVMGVELESGYFNFDAASTRNLTAA